MDTVENKHNKSCEFSLGQDSLTTHDVQNSEQFRNKFNLVKETIYCLDSGNTGQTCTILDKINEFKDKIGEYYFDKHEKVIAIPNQMEVPKQPRILKVTGTKKENDKFLDEFHESKLHNQIVIAVKNLNLEAFVLKGFQSQDCFKAKLEKGKKCRGKDQFADLNHHEMAVMGILEIENITNEDLDVCINHHKQLKSGIRVDENLSWLFKQVKKTEGEGKMKKIADENLESFYRYQWYLFNVQDSSMEWDELVVLPQYKLIINIEVKSGAQIQALKKASSQTVKHLGFFKKMFGAVLSHEWKFVKGACTPNLEVDSGDSPCKYCRDFIVSASDMVDMIPWIQNVISNYKNIKKEEYDTEYKDLLVGLLGFACMINTSVTNQLIIDPLDLSKQTEMKLIAKNIGIDGENVALEDRNNKYEYLCYMLTPEQMNAIKDTSTILFVDGDFGTGKTYVLKEKAKMYAKANPEERIAFMNLTNINGPPGHIDEYKGFAIMDLIAINDFEDFHNIEVVTCRTLFEHYQKYKSEIPKTNIGYIRIHELVENYLKHNEYEYVLIDELPECTGKGQILPDLLQKSKNICITIKHPFLKVKSEHESEWMTEMQAKYPIKRITLRYNMRNSETIVNISQVLGGVDIVNGNKKQICITPEKNVAGPICYYYHNLRKIDYMLLAKAAINKYFVSNPGESVVILTENKSKNIFIKESSIPDAFEQCLRKSFPNRRVLVVDNRKEDYQDIQSFLKKPDGILVTSIKNFRGAQARNVILILNDESFVDLNAMVRDAVLRIMSFAIVIFRDMELTKANRLLQDKDLHEYINIGPNIPFCYKIDGRGYNKVNLVKAVIDKYFKDATESIVILHPKENAEILCKGLKDKFGADKEIVFLPNPSESGLDKYQHESEGDQYQKSLEEYQEKTKAILITNDLNNLKPVINMVVFICNTDTRNYILHYTPQTIIVHNGDLEELDGLQMNETQELDGYLHETMSEKAKRKIKSMFN